MSKPKSVWWPSLKHILRAYPGIKKELHDIRQQSVTVRYNPASGGSGPGRSTEQAAMRELDPARMHMYEAVSRTIRRTGYLPDGALRNKLIRLVYFHRSHNLFGAAEECHVSYATARNWHAAFLRMLAKELGLE